MQSPASEMEQPHATLQAGSQLARKPVCREKNWEVPVDKLIMSQQRALAAKAASSIPGCLKRSTAGSLRDLVISLFLAFERLHQEQWSSSGFPRTRQILKQWSKTPGRLQCDIQDRREVERAGLAQPGEQQQKVRLIAACNSLTGRCREDAKRLLAEVHRDMTKGSGHKLNYSNSIQEKNNYLEGGRTLG